MLRNAAANPWRGGIELESSAHSATAITQPDGSFSFHQLPRLRYALSVTVDGHRIALPRPVDLASPQVGCSAHSHRCRECSPWSHCQSAGDHGGVELSSKSVSQLPLNKRDFSQLLLLAAGTMTDANGATNFTQQFAINGQRRVEATFAMDGADISDPEMGGPRSATTTWMRCRRFNPSQAGCRRKSAAGPPALPISSPGRGAAAFTVHFSNSYAIRPSMQEIILTTLPHQPGRLPPFRRNEFGFTNGGPSLFPTSKRRRQNLLFRPVPGFSPGAGHHPGIPSPQAQERDGMDTTAFPGDVLTVPIDPGIARVLARYPLPNLPMGSFGVHTYASSSPVVTDANQFSVRLDHRISDRSQLFARFNFNNLNGPTTNPDQTVLDPAFAIRYVDRQRNFVVTYTRTFSPRWVWESSFCATRATPSFPTSDFTDPAVKFNDGSLRAFQSTGGNGHQRLRKSLSGAAEFFLYHQPSYLQVGGEKRLNRDTTFFGISPNGEYDFGGGTAYSPVDIASQSGNTTFAWAIRCLILSPDCSSEVPSCTPWWFRPPYFPRVRTLARPPISRNAFGFFAQDTWKISPRLVLDYGLRYELYMPLTDRAKRTSGLAFSSTPAGVAQQFVVNPQPGYRFNKDGLGPSRSTGLAGRLPDPCACRRRNHHHPAQPLPG